MCVSASIFPACAAICSFDMNWAWTFSAQNKFYVLFPKPTQWNWGTCSLYLYIFIYALLRLCLCALCTHETLNLIHIVGFVRRKNMWFIGTSRMKQMSISADNNNNEIYLWFVSADAFKQCETHTRHAPSMDHHYNFSIFFLHFLSISRSVIIFTSILWRLNRACA